MSESILTPVARFGQSAGEMWEVSPNRDSFQAGLKTYRRGLRELTESQVTGLANFLSANVVNHGRTNGPFRSMKDFLTPSALFEGENVLEYSIREYDESVPENERINWDQYFADAPVKIDSAAPSFVTSADLMTALAPIVNVRSDTFVIRTYGEVIRPTDVEGFESSEPQAQAWLEAVVQRFPEGVDRSDFIGSDPEDWSTMIDEPEWGRRFQVISMRWLGEEDL